MRLPSSTKDMVFLFRLIGLGLIVYLATIHWLEVRPFDVGGARYVEDGSGIALLFVMVCGSLLLYDSME